MSESLPQISVIVAMDRNRLIGRNGDLPWRLSNDLQHFKRTTLGKPILMGRKTWDSLGRPLPGRQNIVLTRNSDLSMEGADVVQSLEQAARLVQGEPELMVIGGAQLYELVLPRANRLYITEVAAELEGDTWFPEWPASCWQEVSREAHPADAKNEYAHQFVEYQRNS